MNGKKRVDWAHQEELAVCKPNNRAGAESLLVLFWVYWRWLLLAPLGTPLSVDNGSKSNG